MRVSIDADGRVTAIVQAVEACAFGQAASALVGMHGVGKNGEEAAVALANVERWLDGAEGETLARPAPARSGARAARAARGDPAAVPGAGRGNRGSAMTDAQTTAHATSALLEASAILLGAGTAVRPAVPQAEARRDPGLYRRRRGDRARMRWAGSRDPERLSGLTEIGIALLLFIVGLELDPRPVVATAQGYLRARPGAGGAGGAGAERVHQAIFDPSWQASLAIGLPLALSSTAQVLPMLRRSGCSTRRAASGHSRSCCSRISASSR